MGSVRKASAWLGLVDDNDDERYYDDDNYAEGQDSGDAWVTDPRVKVASETAEETGRRIGTVTPDSFRDARGIGELFRQGVPVIINLTAMEPADAKRGGLRGRSRPSACTAPSSGSPPGSSC